jgi:uncharacterized phiE125 gp8 family phage protein
MYYSYGYSNSYYYGSEPKSSAFNAVLDVQFSDEDSIEPVSREMAKEWAKIESVQDDIVVDLLIKAAREICEKYINHSLINRTVTAVINNTCGNTYLPYGPVKAVTSITNSGGTPLETSQYYLAGIGFKRLQWPNEDNLQIVYTAGYADNSIPSQALAGILCQVAYMYEHRGDDAEIQSQLSPLAKSHLKSIRM